MQEPKSLISYPEHPSQISFPAIRTGGEKPKNPNEKFLGFFADVSAGEAVSTLLLVLNVFLLLVGYYRLKTCRGPLIRTEGGAEVKTHSSAGQAVLRLLAVAFNG